MRFNNANYRSLNESITKVQNPQAALNEALDYSAALEEILLALCEELDIDPQALVEAKMGHASSESTTVVGEGVIRDTVQRVRNKVRGAGFRTDRERDAMPSGEVFIRPASPASKRRHKVEDSKKPGEIWKTNPDSFGQTRVGAKNADGFVRYFRSGMEEKAKAWAKKK